MNRLNRSKLKNILRNQTCDTCIHMQRIAKMLDIDAVNLDKFGRRAPAVANAEFKIYCDLPGYKSLPESNGCGDFVRNGNIVYSPYIPVNNGEVEITPELLSDFYEVKM